MSACPGCGGRVGLDCFNPQECEAISRDMAQRAQEAYYAEAEATHWAALEAERWRDVGTLCGYCWRPTAPEIHIWAEFECCEVVAQWPGGVLLRPRALSELTMPGHER